MELVAQPGLFDYASLDSETRAFVQEITATLHELDKHEAEIAERHAEIILEKGRYYASVRDRLPDMKFSAWLRAEFDMSRQTAYNYIKVFETFSDRSCKTVLQLPKRVLYALAYTPIEVIEQVETGQIPATLPAIREAKQEMRAYTSPDVERDASLAGYKWQDRQWELEKQVYTPPDATSQLLQGTHLATAALEAAIEDKPLFKTDFPPTTTVEHPILNTLTSKSNEWYTPARYVESARELMGGIDLDPASNSIANETVKAARYYDITQNGLDKAWTGRVWLNPPYGRDEAGSNQDIWSNRLIEQYNAGITIEAVLLVNAAVDTKWFQRLFQYSEREPHFFPVCIPDHRINFYSPDNSVSGSTHGSALVYLGTQIKEFFIIFSQFGLIFERMIYRW